MSDQNLPAPKPGIAKLHLYSPGSVTGAQMGEMRKLSSNENLYGPSPNAIAAMQSAGESLWRYPSVDHAVLRQNIGKVHKLDPDLIMCGAGSDEILALIARGYAGLGDEVIMTEHGFEIYGIVGQSVGANVIRVPEIERVVSIDEILRAVSDKTKIIYIANPGNPTGTIVAYGELRRLAAAIPSSVVLVIDSAYAEFAGDYDGGARLVDEFPNVIMTRTFSKLYGLGGLRIGWAYGQKHFIETLNRLRGPFNLSTAALEGASAAVLDQEYAEACKSKITTDRSRLMLGLRQLGVKVDEAFANFVLARFESETMAKSMAATLLENGLAVRNVAHYGLPEALRITIGTTQDVTRVLDVIGGAIHG